MCLTPLKLTIKINNPKEHFPSYLDFPRLILVARLHYTMQSKLCELINMQRRNGRYTQYLPLLLIIFSTLLINLQNSVLVTHFFINAMNNSAGHFLKIRFNDFILQVQSLLCFNSVLALSSNTVIFIHLNILQFYVVLMYSLFIFTYT